MNNYKIQIQGMHCNSCSSLISMELEDAGMQEINVNKDENTATFSTEKEETEVKEILDSIFKNLEKYTYSNLERTTNE